MKKRLKLLIYADSVDNKVGQTIPYMEFFSQFGEVILVHTQSDIPSLMEMADILIVPGGADVDALDYNQRPHFRNGRANMHYQWLDENLLKPWLEEKRPTIGVCRGMQAINVALGGTLHQHISGHNQTGAYARSSTPHLMTYQNPSGKLSSTEINSIHHQSVAKLGEGLELIGWSPAYRDCYSLLSSDTFEKPCIEKDKKQANYDAIVEAFRHKSAPILGFQYHPEEFNCDFAKNEIKNYIISTLL